MKVQNLSIELLEFEGLEEINNNFAFEASIKGKWIKEDLDVMLEPIPDRSLKKANKLCSLEYHPSLVQIYALKKNETTLSGTVNIPRHLLVCEYIPRNLQEYLHFDHQTLNEYQIIELAKQVANGLLYLHSNNIFHGNLSDQNIMFDGIFCKIRYTWEENGEKYDAQEPSNSLMDKELLLDISDFGKVLSKICLGTLFSPLKETIQELNSRLASLQNWDPTQETLLALLNLSLDCQSSNGESFSSMEQILQRLEDIKWFAGSDKKKFLKSWALTIAGGKPESKYTSNPSIEEEVLHDKDMLGERLNLIFQRANDRNEDRDDEHISQKLQSWLRIHDVAPKTVLKVILEHQDKPGYHSLIGFFYHQGVGIPVDNTKAYQFYKIAAENGDAFGKNQVGWCYSKGIGVKSDPKDAAEWYKKSAESGNYSGKSNLAECYLESDGIEANRDEAIRLLTETANVGYVGSIFKLGYCYEEATETKDEKKAFRLYLESASQGYIYGQYYVGKCYESDRGTKKDDKRAFYWYKKAAEADFDEAKLEMAKCYVEGVGVEKDQEKGFQICLKSAQNGCLGAANWVGHYFENGIGTRKNLLKAFYWYHLSALKGGSFGQFRAGFFYLNGMGANYDLHQGIKWFVLAHNNSENGAYDYLNFQIFKLE
ncbi:hypothetical protein G9A89_021752 [Geosiphon pyriformis]|nr:hypothetical protein G9A89_021752 [Geosiphon pyriformis]